MDYKATFHIEYQADNFGEQTDIQDRLERVVRTVLQVVAFEKGLESDGVMGDRSITKGWDSESHEPVDDPFLQIENIPRGEVVRHPDEPDTPEALGAQVFHTR